MRSGPQRHDLPISLADAAVGQTYRVRSIALAGTLGDRLIELGLTPEAPVSLLRRAPWGGPLQVRVRDFVLTLRAEHARAVQLVVDMSFAGVPSAVHLGALQLSTR